MLTLILSLLLHVSFSDRVNNLLDREPVSRQVTETIHTVTVTLSYDNAVMVVTFDKRDDFYRVADIRITTQGRTYRGRVERWVENRLMDLIILNYDN